MVTVPKIESDDLTIAAVYKDFYTVPDFQREYVWEADNVERLLQDIYDEFYDAQGNPANGGEEYFIGSIVVCPGGDGTFHLIDGQQRLTTIYLTLCAIRDYLTELGEQPVATLSAQIRDASLDPNTGKDVVRYRLALQYEDSAGILDQVADPHIAPATLEKTTTSVTNILQAYRTIMAFLVSSFGDDPNAVRKFLADFTLRVKLIRIVTPSLAHALKVFETINERGIGLNAMDLLKNLLFISTSSADYSKLKDKWKKLIDTLDYSREKPLRFLRYYIMAHHPVDWTRVIREDEIYDWFSKNKAECGIDTEPLKFVDTLVECAADWSNYLAGMDKHGQQNSFLRNISKLSGSARQHLILLLAGRKLPAAAFTELTRWIENLFFCYVITRESTKMFERNFARWSADLRACQDSDDLGRFLDQYFRPDMRERVRAFRFAFEELTESRIQQYRLRYVLAKLTQFIEQKAWDNPAHAHLDGYLAGTVDIEHILAQTPAPETRSSFDKPGEYDEYKERLGNLTLLEKTINTAVSNGPYEKKMPGYSQSSFLLTKSLVEKPSVGKNTALNRAVADLIQFETWTSESIERRQKMLGALAEQVWMADVIDKKEEAQTDAAG